MQRRVFGSMPSFGGMWPVLALVLLLTPVQALAQIRYGGGDGASAARAVVITGASGDFDGVQAEYDWLAAHYPGYQMLGQGLLEIHGKPHDLLTFRHQGKEHQVYFDISAFYGKF